MDLPKRSIVIENTLEALEAVLNQRF
jgi:hypothetical protein